MFPRHCHGRRDGPTDELKMQMVAATGSANIAVGDALDILVAVFIEKPRVYGCRKKEEKT